MVRRRSVICTFAWLALIVWVWYERVPHSPVSVYQPGPGKFFEGLTPEGEAVLSSDSGLTTVDFSKIRRGPLELRRLPEFQLTRALFSEDDLVTPVEGPLLTHCLVSTEGGVSLHDLSTGEHISDLPGLPATPVSMAEIDGDRLVALIGQVVWIYDLPGRRVLVKTMGGMLVHSVAAGHAIVSQNLLQPDESFQWTQRVIELETGKLISRWDAVCGALTLSPDGRTIARMLGRAVDVYDFETGQHLWNAALPLNYSLRFEGNDVLAADTGIQKGVVQVARWQAREGTVLGQPHESQVGTGHRQLLDGTDWAIDWTHTQKPVWELELQRLAALCQRLLGNSLARAEAFDEQIALVELRTGSQVAQLGSVWQRVDLVPGGRQIVVCDWDGTPKVQQPLRLYNLPPGRNWWWLVRWAGIPIAAGWGLGAFLRRRRQRTGPANCRPTTVA